MARVVAPINCRVEVIGKPKESNYQPGQMYYNTLFIDLSKPNGSGEAKIWKSLSGDEVSQICKGDTVQLVPAGQDKSGKPRHNILVTGPAPRQDVSQSYPDSTIGKSPTVSDSGLISADQKRAIADHIQQQAKLLAHCDKTIRQSMPEVTDQECIKSYACTLYLGAVRKFGLDRFFQ
jgi:hypothetical protein